LWVRSLDALWAHPIPRGDDAFQPFWSPDGRYIAFRPFFGYFDVAFTPLRGYAALKKVDASGGPPVTLPEAAGSGAWSRRGFILFSGADGRLYRVPDGGGTPIAVLGVDKAQHEVSIDWPVFLADGQRFIFLATSNPPAESALYLASLNSPVRTRLINVLSSVQFAAGHLLYQRDGMLMAQRFDSSTERLIGEPTPIVESVAYNQANGRGAFSASDGVLAYREAENYVGRQLAWLMPPGERLRRLGEPAAFSGPPRLSPDGRRVAIARSDSGAKADLWLIDADRGIPSRMTFDTATDEEPVWTPDSRRVVFRSNRKGKFDLYERALTTTEDRLLFESPEDKWPSGFSSDGKLLLFTRATAEKSLDIWAMPMSDGPPFPVIQSHFNKRYATFSPEGRWLAYDSNDSGAEEVYVRFRSRVRESASPPRQAILRRGVPTVSTSSIPLAIPD
jgi:eukaryotic-like serine/threonine-protein kinase